MLWSFLESIWPAWPGVASRMPLIALGMLVAILVVFFIIVIGISRSGGVSWK